VESDDATVTCGSGSEGAAVVAAAEEVLAQENAAGGGEAVAAIVHNCDPYPEGNAPRGVVQVRCNGTLAAFDLTKRVVLLRGDEGDIVSVAPGEFEKTSGLGNRKKWKGSIRARAYGSRTEWSSARTIGVSVGVLFAGV
jgi:hypothetical protein